MDVAALTAFLAPLLPHLLKIGGDVVDTVADRAGKEVVGFAQRLWDKLRGKVAAKPAADEAVTDVAHHPDDEDLRTALKVQLQKLLEEDAGLAAEVRRIWEEAQAAGAPAIITTVTASGTGSVAIGGDVSGSTITTQGNRPADP